MSNIYGYPFIGYKTGHDSKVGEGFAKTVVRFLLEVQRTSLIYVARPLMRPKKLTSFPLPGLLDSVNEKKNSMRGGVLGQRDVPRRA
jgi:hypothetical protein